MSKYEILQTRPEPDGTGVIYQVFRDTLIGQTIKSLGAKGYFLVPHGQDVDTALSEFLRASGWFDDPVVEDPPA